MRTAGTILYALLVSGLNTPAEAQSTGNEFYRGKTITFVVGQPAGSTFDAYARLISRYLNRHILGRPSVIVQNMPGAASLIAGAHVYNVAPQDGTVIGASSTNLPVQPLIDPVGVRFDPLKFQWLPTPAEFPTALITWHTASINNVDDLRARESTIGSIAAGSPPTVAIGLYNEVLKTRMRPILGYAGLQATMLAMEHGEIEGYPSIPTETLRISYKHHLEAGRIKVLLQTGETRSAEFPDTPTALELVKEETDRALVRLAAGFTMTTTPFMMGPAVPVERVATIRQAFMDTFTDQAFLAESAQQDMRINPVSAEDVTRRVQAAFKSDENVVRRLRRIYEQTK